MNWKIIGKSLKNKDMRKRILAVLGIFIVYRILVDIPVPIANSQTLHEVLQNLFNSKQSPQLLSLFNVLSGGAIANFSIMIAGVVPYINASIIMQLLTKAIPKLEALHKDGEYGQKKINQYTRMLTFPIAIVQSIGSVYLIKEAAEQIGGVGDITAHVSLLQWALMISALTGGSMILMWFGELITEQSIGQGISIIMTVGILSRLPNFFQQILSDASDTGKRFIVFGHKIPVTKDDIIDGVVIVVAVLVVTWIVVMLNEASRKLTINYAKRVQGNRTYGGVTTTLPVKLITTGVIPIIFAVAFLSVPSFVGQLTESSKTAWLSHVGSDLSTWFATPSRSTFAQGGFIPFIYPVVYFVLVFAFTYFYTGFAFNAKEIAENLHKQGGFLDGVRGGEDTEKHLSKIVSRLTLFGATSLAILAVIPTIAQAFTSINITIGGTSVLILVSVALQTLRAIESRALMVTYDQYEQPDFFSDTYLEEDGSEKKTKRRLMKLARPKLSSSALIKKTPKKKSSKA